MQDTPPPAVPYVQQAPAIDGNLSDPVWENALKLELRYETFPGDNVEAPERTILYLAYDRDHLYAAFRCFDPNPGNIRARFRDRDAVEGDDAVSIVLDTFNDQRTAYVFRVNPYGSQHDHIQTTQGSDDSWDAIWSSAAAIDGEGYQVEMAIPFSSIRFQPSEGGLTWSIDAVRTYPREHTFEFHLVPLDRNDACYLCQLKPVRGFEAAVPGNNVEVNPTVTSLQSESGSRAGGIRQDETEAGVTARWGVTPNANLLFTANPDFSQVEADAVNLGINQPFALFFPERRSFFTEDDSVFRTLKNMVHTRTIRDPSGGVKLTGKESGHTFGAFAIRDQLTNLIFPGPTSSSTTSIDDPNIASILRYRFDTGGAFAVGLLATGRTGDAYKNYTYGFDVDYRPTSSDQLQLQVVGSGTQYPDSIALEANQPEGTFYGELIAFEYDHNSSSWGWWLDFDSVDETFRADVGFFPRVGFKNVEGGINYRWFPNSPTWWSRFSTGVQAHYFEDSEGQPFQRRFSSWAFLNASRQTNLSTQVDLMRREFGGREFDITQMRLNGSTQITDDIRAGFSVRGGSDIDFTNVRPARFIELTTTANVHAGDHLNLSLEYEFDSFDSENEHLFTSHVLQSRAVYQFNSHSFARVVLQYVSIDYTPETFTVSIPEATEDLLIELLYSYKINPRTVLFIGYTDQLVGEDKRSLYREKKALFIKLGYSFNF